MIPDVPTVLQGLARSLAMELAPGVQSAYATLTLQLQAALLMMIAQEFDRAAARLTEENAALVALLADAPAVVADAALHAALRDALRDPGTDLRVSALHQRNRTLRELLVRVHAHVETLDGAAARALENRIWAELVASTQRRQLDLANG
jgi:hypothetical protein